MELANDRNMERQYLRYREGSVSRAPGMAFGERYALAAPRALSSRGIAASTASRRAAIVRPAYRPWLAPDPYTHS